EGVVAEPRYRRDVLRVFRLLRLVLVDDVSAGLDCDLERERLALDPARPLLLRLPLAGLVLYASGLLGRRFPAAGGRAEDRPRLADGHQLAGALRRGGRRRGH